MKLKLASFAALAAALAANTAHATRTFATVTYAPGMGTFGTLLFEDNWPSNGDLDFNDQAIAYNTEAGLDSSGNVLSLDATFNVLAVGATFHNGLYLHLPGVPASAVSSAQILDSQGNVTQATLMPGETDVVVEVVNDTRSLFATQYPFINTDPSTPAEAASTALRVELSFNNAVVLDTSTAPFDTFIARSDNYDWQIHLPQYPGTSAAQAWLEANKLGTSDDCSSGTACTSATTGRWFVNGQGLPFALDVPALLPWPQETIAISSVYPDVVAFGTSGGTQNTDWYTNNDNSVNTGEQFTAGAGDSLPPAPVFNGDGDPFNNSDWVQISSGGGVTLAVRADGTLWAWGYNVWGGLGVSTDQNYITWTPVQVGSGYVYASSNLFASYAIKTDGSLWAWGSEADGILGIGSYRNNANVYFPRQIGTGFTTVSAGTVHVAALKTDGTLWGWGNNIQAQLGDGTTTSYDVPTQIGTDTWLSVSASSLNSVLVRSDGTLWSTGDNQYGQRCDGSVDAQDAAPLALTQIGAASNWAYASMSSDFLLAVQQDGTLYACGDNGVGELGNGGAAATFLPTLVGSGYTQLISAGIDGVADAVQQDGSLWAWGDNSAGEVGDGTDNDVINSPEQVPGVSNITAVSSGINATYFVTSPGELWVTGDDNAFGGEVVSPTPVQME